MGETYVQFAEGWKTERCIMNIAEDPEMLYATSIYIYVKGNNLTAEYIQTLVCSVPLPDGSKPVTIDAVTSVDGGFNMHIEIGSPYFPGEDFQITIAGITSGIMTMDN